MRTVTCDHVVYVFSKDSTPVLTVDSDEEVVFQTLDARGGRAMNPEEKYVPLPPKPPDRTNPVTGPVYIKGAQPGDALTVEIKAIRLGSCGYVSARPGIGVLKRRVKESWVRAVQVTGGVIHFVEGLEFPVRPMVGTIGLAPPREAVMTFHPGAHGGNMDCNDVVPGSKLYLPVSVDGALFGLGDVHASMGDGEISGGGLDISADVTVKFGLIKGWAPLRPIVESQAHISTVYSAKSLRPAIQGVVGSAVDLLSSRIGMSTEEAIAFISTACDVGICQACEGPVDVVVRLRMPKLFKLP